MIVYYSEQASLDLDDIVDYIARDNPFRAKTFSEELRLSCRKLLLNPSLLRVVKRKNKIDYRMKVHSNYLIYYSFNDYKLTIHRVIHAARSQRNIV